MRALKILVRLVVFVLLFGLLTVGLVWAFGREQWIPVVRLGELRERRVVHLEKERLFISMRKGEVYAVVDHYFLSGRAIDAGYCEKSGLLETGHAKFDLRGRYYGGPAARGLDTYPAQVNDGWVQVDLQDLTPGLPRIYSGDEPTGPFCVRV